MQHAHPTLQPLLRIPGAPPSIEAAQLQKARAQAWREVMQAEAVDPNVLRALRDQQQHLQSQGALA